MREPTLGAISVLALLAGVIAVAAAMPAWAGSEGGDEAPSASDKPTMIEDCIVEVPAGKLPPPPQKGDVVHVAPAGEPGKLRSMPRMKDLPDSVELPPPPRHGAVIPLKGEAPACVEAPSDIASPPPLEEICASREGEHGIESGEARD